MSATTMLAQATCDGIGVYCYEAETDSQEQPRTNEVLILIPKGEPEQSFTLPIKPWQGNAS